MKNKLMVIILSFTPIVMLAEPPLNLDSLKKEIIHYHAGGGYDVDISKATHLAKHYLADRIRENKHASHPKNWLWFWISTKRLYLITAILKC